MGQILTCRLIHRPRQVRRIRAYQARRGDPARKERDHVVRRRPQRARIVRPIFHHDLVALAFCQRRREGL